MCAIVCASASHRVRIQIIMRDPQLNATTCESTGGGIEKVAKRVVDTAVLILHHLPCPDFAPLPDPAVVGPASVAEPPPEVLLLDAAALAAGGKDGVAGPPGRSSWKSVSMRSRDCLSASNSCKNKGTRKSACTHPFAYVNAQACRQGGGCVSLSVVSLRDHLASIRSRTACPCQCPARYIVCIAFTRIVFTLCLH